MTRILPLLALFSCAALGGCGGLEVDSNAQGDGLFDILFTPRQLTDIVADAQDPFDPDRRARGMLALSTTSAGSDPAYVSLYVENMRDPDASVRAAACKALGRHGSAEHLPLIIDTLTNDKDVGVRVQAATTLQRIHGPEAIEPLLACIRQPEGASSRIKVEEFSEVRAAAALALGQYRDQKVLQGLVAALNDQRLAVNRSALTALRTLTGQDFGYDARPWADWLKNNPKPFAAATVFEYPSYSRDRTWMEYLPFVPRPPNEPSATPAGMPINP